MSDKDQLIIPPAVGDDAASFEILRVWIADSAQHITLDTGVWEDPAAWGIMLADLAKHIARAYHQENGLDEASTLERIKAGLSAELG
jgi:hypothetical protein